MSTPPKRKAFLSTFQTKKNPKERLTKIVAMLWLFQICHLILMEGSEIVPQILPLDAAGQAMLYHAWMCCTCKGPPAGRRTT